MMRKNLLIIFALCIFTVVGCKKKNEPSKLLPGLPVAAGTTILAAQAAQEVHLLFSLGINTIVPVINRLGIPNRPYDELTGPDGSSRYSFIINNDHFGTGTFTIQFRDASDNVIDPISANSSSTSFKSVLVTVTGSSPRFGFSQAYIITIENEGVATSGKSATDTGSQTQLGGSGYTIQYSLGSGVTVNESGITGGVLTGTGTGPTANTTLSLSYQIDHSADGTLTWEGETGAIRLQDNGDAIIITNNQRVLLD